jgi:hypothetical protein
LTRGGRPIDPTRIGTDGISTAATGGYFSPRNFIGNIFRVEAKGGSDDSLSYAVSGFLGSQDYTGSTARLAKGLSATVNVAITERVFLPVTYVMDNFGPFTQQAVYARLGIRF